MRSYSLSHLQAPAGPAAVPDLLSQSHHQLSHSGEIGCGHSQISRSILKFPAQFSNRPLKSQITRARFSNHPLILKSPLKKKKS